MCAIAHRFQAAPHTLENRVNLPVAFALAIPLPSLLPIFLQ